MAMTFNFMVAVGIILGNKLVWLSFLHFLFGTTVAFARPSRSAIFQVGHQQYECYSHLSLTWFTLAMVWSFSTWVRVF